MPLVVKTNEAHRPVHVTTFRARRIVAHPDRPPQLVQKPWWVRIRQIPDLEMAHLLIEELQRLTGKVQGAERVFFALHDMLQKSPYVGDPQVARMSLVVEQDEASHPADKPLARLGPSVAC